MAKTELSFIPKSNARMAFEVFESADAAWDAELVASFGIRSGDARYDERGHGLAGTPLRAAYEARMEAFRAYLAAE